MKNGYAAALLGEVLVECCGFHATRSQWGRMSPIFWCMRLRSGSRENRAIQSSRRSAASMSMKDGVFLCRYQGASILTLETSSSGLPCREYQTTTRAYAAKACARVWLMAISRGLAAPRRRGSVEGI